MSRAQIPQYPESTELRLDLRETMHPLLQKLPDGISEFSFANLYLFRKNHNYRVARLKDNTLAILGKDADNSFFMLPFSLPSSEILQTLFADFSFMKCVSEEQSKVLVQQDITVTEDRDNFDYLYLRQDLAELSGRKFHKKRRWLV